METTSPILEDVCTSENIVGNDDAALSNASLVEYQSQTNEGNNIQKVVDDSSTKNSNSEEGKVVIETENDTNSKCNVDEDDDDEAVIIEQQPSKPIDVDEVSTDELLAFDETSTGEPHCDTSVRSTNTTTDKCNTTDNCNTTKATEFVIVNTTNVACIDSEDETETINRFPMDIQIKDELAEPNIAEAVSGNDVFENDPMDLLEPNDRNEITCSAKSQEEPDEDADDMSTSSSVKTGSSTTTNITDWVKDYPWLLYDEDDDDGYCLYCDAKLNIKSHYYINKHSLSLYHKERCDNYLAFREEEQRNGLCTPLVEIKQEFGTDSRVAALKLKRKTQTEALSNFNWRRWLEERPWLEREGPDGAIGRCKYCRVRLNVEFSYLRDRHQESSKHKECEKQYNDGSNDQHNNTKNDSVNIEDVTEEIASVEVNSKNWCEVQKDDPQLVRCKVCDSKMIKTSFGKHLRSNLHAQNVSNYLQELKQKKNNPSSVNKENEHSKSEDWERYTKRHPWMMADPTDPKYGYCKYCEKRLIYGYSVSKRATHENSSHHKYNEKLFKERARKGASKSDKGAADETESENTVENEENNDDVDQNNDDDGDEEEEEDEDEENEDEDEGEVEDKNDQEEETNEDENEDEEEEEDEDEEEDEEEDADNDEEKTEEQKKDNKKNSKKPDKWTRSETWVNQYPWCKRYSKDPKLIYCTYCKMTLSILYSRAKHENTLAHIAARAKYAKKQEKRSQGNELYEWVVILRNIPNMYSCKYCRVRISNNYSKKSHAASKIHQINENLYLGNSRKTSKSEENAKVNSSQTSTTVTQSSSNSSSNKKVQRFAKVVIKSPSVVTLVKQWQKRFTWLTYKRNELRNHYGYCKTCNTSLYIRSLKHVVRHTRNSKHLSLAKSMRKEKVEQEKPNTRISAKGLKEELPASSPIPSEIATKTPQKQSEETTKESPKDANYNATIEELQKRFSWIDKSHRIHYAFCRYCNVNIPIKVVLLRNHGITVKHRQAVINYSKANKNVNKNQNETETSENAVAEGDNDDDNDEGGVNDNDVMVVEDNNEEILISEQDENWDIKSEVMDEHEELDYLLQRSLNSSHNKRNNQRNNVRKSFNTAEEHPSKRIKRSQSFRRLNDSNTSLVASLLSTPLTLASCLGPLIQQQIHQATNAPTASVPASPAQVLTVEAENTFDLFFKSISETMKKLPVDLAAEGRVKVMQIICDLELQALKRQQVPQSSESVSNNSSTINYTPTSTLTNVLTGQIATSHDVGNGTEQNGQISETVLTQFFTNVSPSTATSQVAPVAPTPTSSTNVNMEQNTVTTAPSPVIGVMDKNGLQTLHLKPSMSKQIPKSTTSSTVTTVSNAASIRCIPFKNLSQTMSAGESNNKFTRIHVPLSSAQSPNTNVTTTTNTPKGVINFRNIQITKRNNPQTSTPSPSSSAVTTVAPSHLQTQHQHQKHQQQQQLQQQQQQQKPIMVNNSPQRTYISNIQPQLQRWGCTVNGTSPNQTISPATINNQMSKKQTSTPITKKFN